MQKNKKNIDGFGDGFSKYRNDKLTDSERNSFERELQKDPFAAEAEEGLDTITQEELERDIALLKESLVKRSKQNNRRFLLSIAAVVLVFVFSGALIIYLNRNNSRTEKIAINTVVPEVQNTQQAPAKSVASPVAPTEKQTIAESQPSKPKSVRVAPIESVAGNMDVSLKNDSVLTESKSPEMKMARAAAGESRAFLSEKEARPAITILTENNSERRKEAYKSENTDPQPLGGMTAFNSYVTDSIRLPLEMKPASSETVILSFIVDSVSAIKEIRIIESPGKPYSDEAIRLLKRGPVWKSATEGNKAVSKTVKLRIDFIK